MEDYGEVEMVLFRGGSRDGQFAFYPVTVEALEAYSSEGEWERYDRTSEVVQDAVVFTHDIKGKDKEK